MTADGCGSVDSASPWAGRLDFSGGGNADSCCIVMVSRWAECFGADEASLVKFRIRPEPILLWVGTN